MTDSPRCGCDRPSHHYGSRACDRPAGPGMSFCYGCYSAGHDRLSPCAPSTARRDDHSDDHDPSGRLCALAGRRFAGHRVDDYCRLCYSDLARSRAARPLPRVPSSSRCRHCGYDLRGLYGSDRRAHLDGWCGD